MSRITMPNRDEVPAASLQSALDVQTRQRIALGVSQVDSCR
jgi:hypothetical protein